MVRRKSAVGCIYYLRLYLLKVQKVEKMVRVLTLIIVQGA